MRRITSQQIFAARQRDDLASTPQLDDGACRPDHLTLEPGTREYEHADAVKHDHALTLRRSRDQHGYAWISISEPNGLNRDRCGFAGLPPPGSHELLVRIQEKLLLIMKQIDTEYVLRKLNGAHSGVVKSLHNGFLQDLLEAFKPFQAASPKFPPPSSPIEPNVSQPQPTSHNPPARARKPWRP